MKSNLLIKKSRQIAWFIMNYKTINLNTKDSAKLSKTKAELLLNLNSKSIYNKNQRKLQTLNLIINWRNNEQDHIPKYLNKLKHIQKVSIIALGDWLKINEIQSFLLKNSKYIQELSIFWVASTETLNIVLDYCSCLHNLSSFLYRFIAFPPQIRAIFKNNTNLYTLAVTNLQQDEYDLFEEIGGLQRLNKLEINQIRINNLTALTLQNSIKNPMNFRRIRLSNIQFSSVASLTIICEIINSMNLKELSLENLSCSTGYQISLISAISANKSLISLCMCNIIYFGGHQFIPAFVECLANLKNIYFLRLEKLGFEDKQLGSILGVVRKYTKLRYLRVMEEKLEGSSLQLQMLIKESKTIYQIDISGMDIPPQYIEPLFLALKDSSKSLRQIKITLPRIGKTVKQKLVEIFRDIKINNRLLRCIFA